MINHEIQITGTWNVYKEAKTPPNSLVLLRNRPETRKAFRVSGIHLRKAEIPRLGKLSCSGKVSLCTGFTVHTTSTGFTVERGDRDLVPMSSSSIDRSEVCFLIHSYFQVAWCWLCPHLCSRSRRSIPFSASPFAGLSRGLLCVSSSGIACHLRSCLLWCRFSARLSF